VTVCINKEGGTWLSQQVLIAKS